METCQLCHIEEDPIVYSGYTVRDVKTTHSGHVDCQQTGHILCIQAAILYHKVFILRINFNQAPDMTGKSAVSNFLHGSGNIRRRNSCV